MSDKHIIQVLESAPLTQLTDSQVAELRAHTGACPACRQAYEAAQISTLLLKEHAAPEFEPSPFFQTRVLAALREQRTTKETGALARLWRAAGALVSSMAAVVATLGVLTFTLPGQPADSDNVAISVANYTAEEVLLNQTETLEDQLSDGQVISTLYAAEDEEAK